LLYGVRVPSESIRVLSNIYNVIEHLLNRMSFGITVVAAVVVVALVVMLVFVVIGREVGIAVRILGSLV
jgi:hypothetical protein